MDPGIVTLAVEGPTDEAVARRLLGLVGLSAGPVHSGRGKGYLDTRLSGFNHAARHSRWLVLRDMDQDAPCASALIARLLPNPAPHICVRIAVHSAEAWLMADRESFSQFLQLPLDCVPLSPDDVPNPKRALLDLVRKKSSKDIQRALLPQFSSSVGPQYRSYMVGFVRSQWRPEVAAQNSKSLHRSIDALRRWTSPL